MTTFEVYVEMKCLRVALDQAYELRSSAPANTEPFEACNRVIAKLRDQIRFIGNLIPTNPCISEGEFDFRVLCAHWVKQVTVDEDSDGKSGA
jgi:hypothetical protein